MFTKEKCTGCGYCEKACTHDAITVESDGIAPQILQNVYCVQIV